MINILEEGASVLEQVACEHMLLVFDYDGTLAPIVRDPACASMRPSTRTLLRLASLLYPCAVLSGRSRTDVSNRLGRLPLLAIVGNHGAEAGYGPVDRTLRQVVVGWKATVESRARDVPGVAVEDKGYSLAIHYRNAVSRATARHAIRDVVAQLPAARAFGGRAVVNVVPAGAHHKGRAVQELLERTGIHRALYLGDDTTDEDAFRAEGVGLGVRVGRTHHSAAHYYVPAQTEVDALLRALVRARRLRDGLDADVAKLETLIESVAGGP